MITNNSSQKSGLLGNHWLHQEQLKFAVTHTRLKSRDSKNPSAAKEIDKALEIYKGYK